MLGWLRADFVLGAPHEIGGGRTNATEVRTGVIDDRNFESFGVGLLLTTNRNVHPVFLTVLIGIEFSFDPEIVFDPIGGFFEARNYLSESVFENRDRFFDDRGFRLGCYGWCDLGKTKAWADEPSD